ncbi:glycerophosphodiester phosphodiesterase family protein [Brevundimonas sp. Root1279]|uniref:glycerophosphodiester phosphodiesterase family protein n=1 Tax=Brevundimonas sp. Root1279 TaxID=1736443 RepID=UPI0006F2ECF5|nr:glycerophosphodiester phosphodiesterase family protein [Brevundimonas sp. Root1279]KQW78856.1 glycerophosphodiester phosphodiesterase [Brevundimonas sp. Root1279]
MLIIAHRGACGERPEHTRAAYELAIDQGADVIEPDLVMSRDGALIVRHDVEIGQTTDVADRAAFRERRTTRPVDGLPLTGWFAEDFTLAELQTLRARERMPLLRPANTAWDGREPILTFEEVIEIARRGSARTGRTVAVAPELKHPTHLRAAGLDLEATFVAALERHGLTGADAPVIVQCFEPGTLQRLRARVATPLLQLIAAVGAPADRTGEPFAALTTPKGLARVATYADWIGVDLALIEPEPDLPSSLIADAHAAGLKVAGWTFRAENLVLPELDRLGDDPLAHGRHPERLARFATYGLDAAFTDQIP